MRADDFYHYHVLGLQPGASPREIHAAYRRLAKRLHPDQDPSLDAEMRYREIRAAYDALRHKAETGAASRGAPRSRPPGAGAADGRSHGGAGQQTVYGNAGWYVKDDGEDDAFDFSDLMWEYGGRKAPKKRLPFSLKNLPDILRTSFKEVFGVGMTVRFFLTAWLLWGTLSEIGWSRFGKVSVVLCILLAGLLYRYYFPSPPQRPVANAAGSFLCSAALGVLCAATGNSRMFSSSFLSEIYTFFFVIFIQLLFLWAHPFSWDWSGVFDPSRTGGPSRHNRGL